MKTKNNTFKRIAAGALATISVATNVMSANVGGSPFVDAIRASLVAQAAVGDDAQVDFGGINKYLTSFSNGTTTFDTNALSGLEGFKAKEGDTITVKSSIPLTFNKKVDESEAHLEGAVQGADGQWYKKDTTITPTIDSYEFTDDVKSKVDKSNNAIFPINNDSKIIDVQAYNNFNYYNVGSATITRDAKTGTLYSTEGATTASTKYKFENRLYSVNVGEGEYKVATSLTHEAALELATYEPSWGYRAYNQSAGVVGSIPADSTEAYTYFDENDIGENDIVRAISNQVEVLERQTASADITVKETDAFYNSDGIEFQTGATIVTGDVYYTIKAVVPVTFTVALTESSYNLKNGVSAYVNGSADFANITNPIAKSNVNNYTYYNSNTSSVMRYEDGDYKVVEAATNNDGTYNFGEIAIQDIYGGYCEITAMTDDDIIAKDMYTAPSGFFFLSTDNPPVATDATTAYGVTHDASGANAPAVYVVDNMKVGYAEIDDNFYKVVNEADNGVTETAALKDGKVYATKSGNSFVYTYKVTSAVKIVGQKTTVEITNGLPNAYTTAEAYNNLDDDAQALCAWGDTTDNALLKGTRPVVSDLTFDSDIIEPAAEIAEYDGDTVDTNVTGDLDAYKNENVVLSSSNYFKVRIWDGNQKTAYKEYATKFNSKTNRWECTFPAYVEAKDNITRVLVEKADPVYTYTTDGSVLSVSGSGIDSEAAYIKAYAVSKADAENNGQGKPVSDADKKKYAITSNTTQSYGSSVYVDIERIAEFASAKNSVNEYSTLKITRNGKEIIGTDDPNTANINETVNLGTTQHTDKYDAVAVTDVTTDRAQNFTFNQPGEYEITYTVYINANKTTAVAKELKFKFTIDTQAKLTASNAKLTFSSKDAGIITGATLVTNENAAQFPEAEVGSYVKVVTGAENLKLPVDVEDLKNKSIDVTATLVDAKGTDLGIKVILSGATTVNELNLSQPLYITYNNDQYSTGSETIVINWQAVSKAKQFNIFQPDGETPLYTEIGNNYEVNVSVDEIADIQKIVENNYVLKNGDAKKISYEYSVGKGDKLESQELDWHEAGFPKEIGEYSLYILYANEPIAIVDLNVIKHSLHAAPTDAQLNITYGDKLFTEEELGYADAEGKAVKDADVKNPEIKFYATNLLNDANVKQIVDGKFNGATVYEKDGKYYTLGNAVGNPYNAPLNAGVYVAEIKAKNGNATTVGKSDYTLMSDTFVLSVAKKQITADMITIAPKNYKNDYYTITTDDIVGKDTAITKNFANAATAVNLKIASGEQSGKNIGGYTVNVTVADNEQNYTGTVKNFKWYIIKGAEKDGENYSGLFWNDTETTIVDNGNINVEFGKSANLVGEVVEFGFIGDKSGKIGAPTKGTYTDNKSSGIYNYSNNFNATTGAALNTDNHANADPNVQAAYSELVYGAGINPAKQNAAMIAKKGADTFGVSVRIEDANTGVWVRPYLILKVDGEEKLYYGEVRYLNLVEEATAMLNLKASAMGAANNNDHVAQEAVTKDQAKAQYADNSDLAYMEDAKSGYWAEKNQFYAYAHYNFDKNSKVKDSAIQGFGVVLDKSGYIPAGAFVNDGAGNMVIDKTTDAYKKACEVLIPANKGKNGILSGISKDNPKMLKNEMGVAVNPKDAVTGVWLRSFVDFGNGLIVYTDPVYIKSVSEQYAACKPGVVGNKAANAAKINYTVTANANGNADAAAVIPKFKGANAVIKEAGVVVDKNGTLFKLNDDGEYTGFVDDITTKFIADNATANGYNKGKKGIDINPATVGTTIFTGHAFQVTNKSGNYIKTVARPFVVYTINGKDITIYGEPVVDTTGDATYPEVAKG